VGSIGRGQLSQDILENTAVEIIVQFYGGIDAQAHFESDACILFLGYNF
jgi:hypothetical protein